jgi:hypothetical protein
MYGLEAQEGPCRLLFFGFAAGGREWKDKSGGSNGTSTIDIYGNARCICG